MERGHVRFRLSVLAAVTAVLLVVACGRATDEQIDQALGITPTPTVDAELAARETEEAAAQAASPADENMGVAALGQSKFQFNCQMCHSASGTGPDLLAKGGPGANLDYATLYPIVREGERHSPSPGPIPEFKLTDADIANIGAYIREQAAP